DLEQALDALEKDHEFLLRGDVFTKDAIHEWLDYKRTKELNPIRMRPTPHEFYLYFDILFRWSLQFVLAAVAALQIEASDGKDAQIAELLPRPLPTELTEAEVTELSR